MEEDHKNAERAQEQSDKLNARLKKMKSQLEEAVSLFYAPCIGSNAILMPYSRSRYFVEEYT